MRLVYKLFTVSKPYDIIVLEYGIDHPGDMQFLTDIVQPDYSIFTKLDGVHGAYFENTTAIWDEKFILMQRTQTQTYLNASDEYCISMGTPLLTKEHPSGHKGTGVVIKWYNGKWIDPNNYQLTADSGNIISKFSYASQMITTNLIGEENSFYIALGLDIAEQLWAEHLSGNMNLKCELQPGRCSILEWKNDAIIIDSSYNAAPASMKKMIENATYMHKNLFPDYIFVCVLWDMRELWEMTEPAHTKMVENLDNVDMVYTVWPEMQQYLDITGKQSFLSSRAAGKTLAEEIISHPDKKYFILVKGSQNTIFTEEAVKELLKNPDDALKLVRQDNMWMGKKETFFSEIEKTLA